MAAIRKEDHVVLKWKREDHVALAEWGLIGLGQSQDNVALGYAFLPRGLGSRRDFAGKKRGERILAGGP